MADKCPDTNLLISYISGEITDEDALVVEEHASVCAKCSYTLAKMVDAGQGHIKEVKISASKRKEIELLIGSFQSSLDNKPPIELMDFLKNVVAESFELGEFENGLSTLSDILSLNLGDEEFLKRGVFQHIKSQLLEKQGRIPYELKDLLFSLIHSSHFSKDVLKVNNYRILYSYFFPDDNMDGFMIQNIMDISTDVFFTQQINVSYLGLGETLFRRRACRYLVEELYKSHSKQIPYEVSERFDEILTRLEWIYSRSQFPGQSKPGLGDLGPGELQAGTLDSYITICFDLISKSIPPSHNLSDPDMFNIEFQRDLLKNAVLLQSKAIFDDKDLFSIKMLIEDFIKQR